MGRRRGDAADDAETQERRRRLNVALAARGWAPIDLARAADVGPEVVSRLRAGRPGRRLTWADAAAVLGLPAGALEPGAPWEPLLPRTEPEDRNAARTLRLDVALAARDMALADVARGIGIAHQHLSLLRVHGLEVGRACWAEVRRVLDLPADALEPGAPWALLLPPPPPPTA